MDISPPLLAFLFSRERRRRRGNLLLLFLLAKSLRGTAEETFADYSICHFSREILLRLRSNYSINFPISRYAEYSFAQRGAPRPQSPSFFTCAGAGRSWKGGGLLLAAFILSLVSTMIIFFGMKLLLLICLYVCVKHFKHFYIDSSCFFRHPDTSGKNSLPRFSTLPPTRPAPPRDWAGKGERKRNKTRSKTRTKGIPCLACVCT